MAILKDFIEKTTFEEVWALLGTEETEAYRESYMGIFTELQTAQPKENEAHMTIRFVEETAPEWDFYFDTDEDEDAQTDAEPDVETPVLQVYGFIPGDDEGYAIGLKPTEVLAGLDVDPETEKTYTPAEIAAHCLAEIIYTATVASSAYGMEKDMAGGGLLASQSCMSEDIQNVDLDKLREELGVLPKPEEDYKTKYGFLF